MKCPTCHREKGHTLACGDGRERLQAVRDGMEAERIVRISKASGLPVEQVAMCRPEILAMVESLLERRDA